MGNRGWIEAPHRIVDHDLQRVVYGTGDRVPLHDAVKYGLIPADQAPHGPHDPADGTVPPAEPAKRRRGRRPKPAQAPDGHEAGAPSAPDEAR